MDKKLYKLNINDKFKKLIPPLSKDEYVQLEENITRNGCREPICVWNNTIIDGHNRYEICQKNNIPFYIQEITDITFDEDAIVWICSNQLGRRNISDECRKLLIGEKYNAEMIVNSKKNPNGINQYSKNKNKSDKSISCKTAKKIAHEFNISEASVRRYARLSKAVDILNKTNPKLANDIKNGYARCNHNEANEIISENNKRKDSIYIQKDDINKKKKFQIKEMPKYNPNAEFESLASTIPSWQGSIDRLLEKKNINSITYSVKQKLKTKLEKMKFSIEAMLYAIGE